MDVLAASRRHRPREPAVPVVDRRVAAAVRAVADPPVGAPVAHERSRVALRPGRRLLRARLHLDHADHARPPPHAGRAVAVSHHRAALGDVRRVGKLRRRPVLRGAHRHLRLLPHHVPPARPPRAQVARATRHARGVLGLHVPDRRARGDLGALRRHRRHGPREVDFVDAHRPRQRDAPHRHLPHVDAPHRRRRRQGLLDRPFAAGVAAVDGAGGHGGQGQERLGAAHHDHGARAAQEPQDRVGSVGLSLLRRAAPLCAKVAGHPSAGRHRRREHRSTVRPGRCWWSRGCTDGIAARSQQRAEARLRPRAPRRTAAQTQRRPRRSA
mmetsp:Transcript_25819/g.103136  ORF Transcript_25819/g.103136 Transcript_25819/m.103136 type:complete len:326 (+) Transcript_25819:312-1289(+)